MLHACGCESVADAWREVIDTKIKNVQIVTGELFAASASVCHLRRRHSPRRRRHLCDGAARGHAVAHRPAPLRPVLLGGAPRRRWRRRADRHRHRRRRARRRDSPCDPLPPALRGALRGDSRRRSMLSASRAATWSMRWRAAAPPAARRCCARHARGRPTAAGRTGRHRSGSATTRRTRRRPTWRRRSLCSAQRAPRSGRSRRWRPRAHLARGVRASGLLARGQRAAAARAWAHRRRRRQHRDFRAVGGAAPARRAAALH